MYRTKYIDLMKSKVSDELHFARTKGLAWAAILAIGVLAHGVAAAQTAVISTVPDADAFVWSTAPTSNYGAAGALAVSGSNAVNGSGVQMGLFDSLVRFPMSNVVSTFD